MNWPTIAFLVLFVVLAVVESGRYLIVFNFSENKIKCYSLYKWFAKEEKSTDLKSVVTNNNYITFKFKHDSWCLFFKKYDCQKVTILLEDQGFKVYKNKNSDLFNQFFKKK